jgi:hypothetical protein
MIIIFGILMALAVSFIVIKLADMNTDNSISSKISNFKRLPTVVKHEGFMEEKTYYATVDVTTGFLFKKTVERKVFKTIGHWKFLDTGKYCPGTQVEDLDASEKANKEWQEANSNQL